MGSWREAEAQVVASIEPRILLAPEVLLVSVPFIDSSSCDGRHYFNLPLTKQKCTLDFQVQIFCVKWKQWETVYRKTSTRQLIGSPKTTLEFCYDSQILEGMIMTGSGNTPQRIYMSCVCNLWLSSSDLSSQTYMLLLWKIPRSIKLEECWKKVSDNPE